MLGICVHFPVVVGSIRSKSDPSFSVVFLKMFIDEVSKSLIVFVISSIEKSLSPKTFFHFFHVCDSMSKLGTIPEVLNGNEKKKSMMQTVI